MNKHRVCYHCVIQQPTAKGGIQFAESTLEIIIDYATVNYHDLRKVLGDSLLEKAGWKGPYLMSSMSLIGASVVEGG